MKVSSYFKTSPQKTVPFIRVGCTLKTINKTNISVVASEEEKEEAQKEIEEEMREEINKQLECMYNTQRAAQCTEFADRNAMKDAVQCKSEDEDKKKIVISTPVDANLEPSFEAEEKVDGISTDYEIKIKSWPSRDEAFEHFAEYARKELGGKQLVPSNFPSRNAPLCISLPIFYTCTCRPESRCPTRWIDFWRYGVTRTYIKTLRYTGNEEKPIHEDPDEKEPSLHGSAKQIKKRYTLDMRGSEIGLIDIRHYEKCDYDDLRKTMPQAFTVLELDKNGCKIAAMKNKEIGKVYTW